MTLLNLYKQKIVISRMTLVSTGKYTYATLTSDYGNIQRMSEEKTIDVGGALGKMFRLYLESEVDIDVGDKLVDANSNQYRVTAVTIPVELGAFEHKEVIIEQVD